MTDVRRLLRAPRVRTENYLIWIKLPREVLRTIQVKLFQRGAIVFLNAILVKQNVISHGEQDRMLRSAPVR